MVVSSTPTTETGVDRFLGPIPAPSYWLQTIGGTPPAPLQTPETETTNTTAAAPPTDMIFDCAIIGAGISGMATAFHLSKLRPHWQIAVLDARPTVASGATGRNGGLLWPNIGISVSEYARKYGTAQALKLYHFDHANVDAIAAFCIDFNAKFPNSGFDPLCIQLNEKAIQTLSTDKEQSDSNADFAFLEANGINPSAIIHHNLTATEVTSRIPQSLSYSGFNLSNIKSAKADLHAHQIHPARLVLALAKVASPAVSFFPNCSVSKISRISDNLFKLDSVRGVVTARTVVYATNAWTRALLPQLPIVPVRNQVIVANTSLVAAVAVKSAGGKTDGNAGGCWGMSVNSGFEYYSARPDGRIVFGGMRYQSSTAVMDVGVSADNECDSKVSQALRAYARRAFGSSGAGGSGDDDSVKNGEDVVVETEWAGIMGFTPDGLPFVGALNGVVDGAVAGEFVIAGFTGHGMSRCFLTGKAVARMVCGEPVGDEFPDSFVVSKERIEMGIEKVGMSEPPFKNQ
ncbi:hypothetical protein HK100_011122 [Physocladia obscura]|uniref:FAD dependent oxidoreductase domain-containing protein n=1 Tax=Physocladia obscura TaxID=109957 RepID=A0AAD5T1V0_9FUNG|nr:hypothetical protein HK100_011122 [Physocladia obscura]